MRQFLGLLALALLVPHCPAADATPQSIDALVQKLGSAKYSDRENAGTELLKIGQPAMAAVRSASENHADPEVRERAAALLEPLSKSFDSSKLLTAKLIKLEAKTQPLDAAINELKAKTGIPLLIDKARVKDTARLVTVPAGEHPPWEAVDVVLKGAGLREDFRAELPAPATPPPQNNHRSYSRWDGDGVQNNYSPSTAPIVLVDGIGENLPALRSGGVRIVALPPNFVSNRVIRGAGRVIFHLDVAPVPTLGWSSASGVRITAAEDEDGRPVFADLKLNTDSYANSYDPWGNGWGGRWGGGRRVFWGGGGMSYYGGGGGGTGNENPRLLAVALRTNDRMTTMLRKFEGVVLGDVHTPNVPIITVENLAKAGGTSYSGPMQSNLTIQDFKKDANGSHMLRIKYESLTQWGLMQMNGNAGGNFINVSDNPSDILTKFKYYDAEGKVIPNPNSESTSTSSDGFRQSVEVTLRFKKTDKLPTKLVVSGTKVTNVEVPFKLVNVRVP